MAFFAPIIAFAKAVSPVVGLIGGAASLKSLFTKAPSAGGGRPTPEADTGLTAAQVEDARKKRVRAASGVATGQLTPAGGVPGQPVSRKQLLGQ